MRVPISESEVGYWYKIGKNCFFVREGTWQDTGSHIINSNVRQGTFAEFKKVYPKTVYDNGSQPHYRKK